MKSNATRMQLAVEFVVANPGSRMAAVVAHVLDAMVTAKENEGGIVKPSAYKQAASVVERVIKDRLVRQVDDHLHPWNERLKLYAEALERAATLAPDDRRYVSMIVLAIAAWREAGDENRAQILERLAKERLG